jgi:hypothetical protein
VGPSSAVVPTYHRDKDHTLIAVRFWWGLWVEGAMRMGDAREAVWVTSPSEYLDHSMTIGTRCPSVPTERTRLRDQIQ